MLYIYYTPITLCCRNFIPVFCITELTKEQLQAHRQYAQTVRTDSTHRMYAQTVRTDSTHNFAALNVNLFSQLLSPIIQKLRYMRLGQYPAPMTLCLTCENQSTGSKLKCLFVPLSHSNRDRPRFAKPIRR